MGLNREFQNISNQFPDLLERLVKSSPRFRSDLGEIPKKGIYVFYEDEKPIYVGRSNNLKRRIQEHGVRSSDRFSATFAFRIAINNAKKIKIDVNRLRSELEKDADFAALYDKAKERVRNMSVRTIEIDDQIIQTIFEVYACVALKTWEYNDFSNH